LKGALPFLNLIGCLVNECCIKSFSICTLMWSSFTCPTPWHPSKITVIGNISWFCNTINFAVWQKLQSWEVRSSCRHPWDNCPFKISSGNLESASSLTVKKYIGSVHFEWKNAVSFKQKLTFTCVLFTVGLIKKI
jgi:hypothetical protein